MEIYQKRKIEWSREARVHFVLPSSPNTNTTAMLAGQAAAVDNDDGGALASLEIAEVLALLQHATTQIQSLTRSNASIAALLVGKAEGDGDGGEQQDEAQSEAIELDEEDRAELALALRENRDIM